MWRLGDKVRLSDQCINNPSKRGFPWISRFIDNVGVVTRVYGDEGDELIYVRWCTRETFMSFSYDTDDLVLLGSFGEFEKPEDVDQYMTDIGFREF